MEDQYLPARILVYVSKDPDFFYSVSLFYLPLLLPDQKLPGISDSEEFRSKTFTCLGAGLQGKALERFTGSKKKKGEVET